MTVRERSGPRKAPRQVRRDQLVEATIDVLAHKGYAALTLADVTRRAGLSGGLINFHFRSKDELLRATLRELARRYRANWTAAVAAAGDDPARRLYAMTGADFDAAAFPARILQAWVSFWAEAQSRPHYAEDYGGEERQYLDVLETLCAQLVETGGEPDQRPPAVAARVINALTDGLWVALAQTPPQLSHAEAHQALRTCLASLFPAHFDADGPIN